MSLHQLLLILAARYKTVLTIMAATVSVTVAASLLFPEHYTASSTVVLDIRSPEPVAGLVPSAFTMPSYVPTQVGTIMTPRVAQGAVALLRSSSPELYERWLEESRGAGESDRWLAEWLQKRVKVAPGKESNLISISFTSRDPVLAAAAANAFTQAYVDTDIALKIDPARSGATWLESQEKLIRARLEQAETRISEYQQKNGLVAVDERLDHEVARLNELSTQLTTAESVREEAEGKARAALARVSLPEMVHNELINSLKSQLGRAEAKFMEVSEDLGPNHPMRQGMEAEIASLRERLREETGKVTASFVGAGAVSRNKEAALRKAIESQKAKLLQMRQQRDELSALMRERDSARKAYESVSQRLTQTSLESKATQTNIAVLSPAFEPLRPSYPKPFLYGLIAAVAGFILGAIGALARESRHLPARSLEEVEAALALPVLAVLVPERALPKRGALPALTYSARDTGPYGASHARP
jgi:chain length determinant protein EpsF